MSDFEGDPVHPILHEPWRWELLEFTYRRNRTDWHESYVDMVFYRDGKERRLRFFAPQDVELSRGTLSNSGLCILDVSARQLDGLRVRVISLEMSYGTPSFWAAEVIEIREMNLSKHVKNDGGAVSKGGKNEGIHMLEDFICDATNEPPFPIDPEKN